MKNMFLFTNPHNEIKPSISMQILVPDKIHTSADFILFKLSEAIVALCLTAYISLIQILVLGDILGNPFWSLKALKSMVCSVSR